MKIKGFFEKMNKLLCSYIGLEKEKIRPHTIQIIGDELFVTNTTPFKRHSFKENWNSFSTSSITQTTDGDLEKLGLAIGKAIAKKLVVSFEETHVEKN